MRDRYKREVLDARAKRLPKVPARILQPSRDEILHLMEVRDGPRPAATPVCVLSADERGSLFSRSAAEPVLSSCSRTERRARGVAARARCRSVGFVFSICRAGTAVTTAPLASRRARHERQVDAFPRYLVWSGKRKSAQKRASCRPDIVLLHMRGSSENPIVHSATDIWDDRDDSADRI
jgi:hypothetical protein